MTFTAERSAIANVNRALGRIFQQPIQGTLDNPTNSVARVAADRYPVVVRTLLGQHHFGLASKRVTLIEATNDRSGEWLAAYTPPTDMAFPVGFTPWGATNMSYYRALGGLYGELQGRKVFAYEGGLLYSSLGSPELSYVSLDITEDQFTQEFENLVVVFLASELAHPIAKDRDLANDLYKEGMSKLNWAIAQNLNMGNPTYGNAPTETEIARGGGIPGMVDRLMFYA